jgi:cytidylate kinase
MALAPVRVITIEREYGSRGGEFAHDLAERLGWRLLDSELVTAAARRAGVNPEVASKFDEHLDPWYYRYGKIFWHDTAYQMSGISEERVFDCERMFTLIRDEVTTAAKEGNCVIVGRGAACALARQPGSFHVFVYATSKAKREWFIRNFPRQAHNAEESLAAFDKRRAAVIRRFYQQEWNSRCLYHMMLNSAMGTDAMIATVQAAAGLEVSIPVSAAAEISAIGPC